MFYASKNTFFHIKNIYYKKKIILEQLYFRKKCQIEDKTVSFWKWMVGGMYFTSM